MPGTVRREDLQQSIEDQLQGYARDLTRNLTVVGDTAADLERAGRAKLQDVQSQLSAHVNTLLQPQPQQEPSSGIYALNQPQEPPQNPLKILTDYASSLTSQQPQPAPTPPRTQMPQETDFGGSGANVTPGVAPAALPHNEEPATATDVQRGPDLGSQWKTQFDFRQTYTGNYRTGTPHRGIDLVPSNGRGIGTEVDAFVPGRVTQVFRDPGGAGGLIVYVQDEQGLTHAYMHLNSANVRVGDTVQRGQPIATMGESGTEGSPHLHYEVRHNAAVGDPLDQLIDPRPYMAGGQRPGQGPIQQAVSTVTGGRIDASSPEAFARSVAPYAANAARQLGIDPTWVASMMASESNYGNAPGNELFGVKGTGTAGSQALQTHEGEYGGRQTTGQFAAYNTPQESVDAWVDLIKRRYPNAIGAPDLASFVHGLKQGGYFTAAEDEYRNIVQGIQNRIGGAVTSALGAARDASEAVGGQLTRPAPNTDVMQVGDQTRPAPRQPLYFGQNQAVDQEQNPILRQLQVVQDQVDALRSRLSQTEGSGNRIVQPPAEEPGAPPLRYDAGELSPLPRPSVAQRSGEMINRFRELPGGQPLSQLGVPDLTPPKTVQEAVQRASDEAMNRQYPGLGPGGLGLVDPRLGGDPRAENPDLNILGRIGESLPSPGALPDAIASRIVRGVEGVGEVTGPIADALAHIAGIPDRAAREAAARQIVENLDTSFARARRGEPNVPLAGAGGPPVPRPAAVGEQPEVLPSNVVSPEEADAAARLRAGPEPPARLVEPRFPQVARESAAPPTSPLAGVQREAEYPAGQIESRVQDIMRQSRETSPDGLAHVNLNDLPDDVMPFNRNAPTGQGLVIKTNPGGMPTMDDLRALYEANEHKRSFYVDQGDEAANIVGSHNTGEFFTLNSITSMLTPVSRQVAEAIQAIGLVRQVARDARAAGDSPEVIRTKILEALNDNAQNTLSGKSLNNKRKAMLEAYSTGAAPVGSGAKTSTFAGNYGSAEGRFFDPRITNDIHNWRIMNVASDELPSLRKNKKTGEYEWFFDRPAEKNAANNDQAYRAVEAVMNELARERGIDGFAVQSAMWDGMRAMQMRDPASYQLWQQGFFKRAIERAKERGVFGSVTDAIENPGDIQAVMRSEPVQRQLAKWSGVLHDPLPPELGVGSTVERSYAGKGRTAALRRPSNLALRVEERPLAESNAPLVHGLDRSTARQLGLDEQRGIFPWLENAHRVVAIAPDEYAVHLPSGNEDTARYVAAVVGQASDAERVRIHVPDRRATSVAGVHFRGSQDEVAALERALDNMGVPNIRGTGGASLQMPLQVAGRQSEIDAIIDAATSVGANTAGLNTYTGRTADVPRSAYASTQQALSATFGPTTAGRSDLLQRGLGAVPAGEPATGGGDVLRGRQRGEVSTPFAINLAGSAVGGAAGYAAPADTPEDRLRNVGIGATAGLLGTIPFTRGGGPAAERALAGAGREVEGFRAPTRGDLEDLVRATTQEPPGEGAARPGREPRRLEDVQSNPYGLREVRPGETPMTVDEMVDYGGQLEDRLQELQNRRDSLDEMIRNPGEKVQRPPWAAGWKNDELVELARRNGANAYQESWWEPLGFYTEAGAKRASGEMREDVGQSGIRGTGTRELSPTELRRERAALDKEISDITAAYEQMSNAPAGAQLRRVEEVLPDRGRTEDLPFDSGAEPEAVPIGDAQGSRSEGARKAQEIVLGKRGTIRSTEGEVIGERGGVTGRSIVSQEAIDEATRTPPSARTVANMPNLDSLFKGEMPELHAQIRKSAEDNPELFEAYRRGVISHDELRDDLANRVGMSLSDWNKTKPGHGFTNEELVALQAAAIEHEGRLQDLGQSILAKGGVDKLTPEELAFSMQQLVDTQRLLAVARGGRSSQGRGLNALKIKFDRGLASGITASNEAIAARRLAEQARRASTRATALLKKGHELATEATTAKAEASRQGAPKNILQQIDDAYAQLDRYQAMTLHEKGEEFKRLAAERAKRAAERKARVRGAPEELLSALKAELKAEQDIFAKRKDAWETMAFWDTKANENAINKRNAFRGQLYLEQSRKVANIAAKDAEKEAARAFDQAMQRRVNQSAKAERLLEAMGGKDVSKEMLQEFLVALNDPSPYAAAKFLKGTSSQSNWARANVIRIAGLLSGPITHLVNIGGNVANAAFEIPTRQTVVGIDKLRQAIGGGERMAYQAEMLPQLVAMGPGAWGALPEAVRALQTGITPAELADLSKVRPGFSSSEALNNVVEMPLRLLTAEDIVFRRMAVAQHGARVAWREASRYPSTKEMMARRAANIMQNLEDYPELAAEVYDAAARQVFQEKRTVPGLSKFGEPNEAARLAYSQVMPFTRTPANITSQGFAASPLGFIGAYQAARQARRMPVGTAAERALQSRQVLLAEERAARALLGTAILSAGMAMGAAKMLTAGYPEDQATASTLPQGWRPWSMRLENPTDGSVVYVPFQNLGPAGVPMAMAAILTDPSHRGKTILDDNELGKAGLGIGKYLTDNTFLQGLDDLTNAFTDPKGAQRFFEPLAASYGPYNALGREMQRQFGVATRNPHDGVMGLWDALEANYPGVSGNVPPALTPIGEERTQGATGISRLVPYRYDVERDEPTLRVLRENSVGIPTQVRAVNAGNGWSIKLTDQERDTLQQQRGQLIRDQVTALQQTATWQKAVAQGEAGLASRNALLKRAVSNATQNANVAFVRSLPRADLRDVAAGGRAERKEVAEPYILGATP